MKKGYRLSAPVALANYYADVNNMAEFGIREMAGAAGTRVRSMAGGAKKRLMQAPGYARSAAGAGMNTVGAVGQAGVGYAKRNPRKAAAMGIGGAAALGGAGYLGYRALQDQNAEEEMYG